MNYLDIKKDLKGFEGELGYKEVIKAILSYELNTNNENILNQIYEKYINNSEYTLLNEDLIEEFEYVL